MTHADFFLSVPHLNLGDPIEAIYLSFLCPSWGLRAYLVTLLWSFRAGGNFGRLSCSLLFSYDMQPFLLPYSSDHAGFCNSLRLCSAIGYRFPIVLRFPKYAQFSVFPSLD